MCTEPVILHGTDDWLVVDKPAGWHTTAGRGETDVRDLESWLRGHVSTSVDLHEAGLVHLLVAQFTALAVVQQVTGQAQQQLTSDIGRFLVFSFLFSCKIGLSHSFSHLSNSNLFMHAGVVCIKGFSYLILV